MRLQGAAGIKTGEIADRLRPPFTGAVAGTGGSPDPCSWSFDGTDGFGPRGDGVAVTRTTTAARTGTALRPRPGSSAKRTPALSGTGTSRAASREATVGRSGTAFRMLDHRPHEALQVVLKFP